MKSLSFRKIINNYLYDNDHFITIYDNKIYIYNYLNLNDLTEKLITIQVLNKKVSFIGNDFKILKMSKKELLIEGIIQKVNYFYD